MTSRIFTILLACLFLGCGRHYLVLHKTKIDRDNLASTYARSPDPVRENLPCGEEIYISWVYPYSLYLNGYSIVLEVIYRDLSSETITYSILSPIGVEKFQLAGEKFYEKKGFFAYKATLLDGTGGTVDIWQHVMWVKVIE